MVERCKDIDQLLFQLKKGGGDKEKKSFSFNKKC